MYFLLTFNFAKIVCKLNSQTASEMIIIVKVWIIKICLDYQLFENILTQ